MSYSNDYKMLKAQVSEEEVRKVKRIAKSEGMTLQGWLRKILIREIEITESQEANNG